MSTTRRLAAACVAVALSACAHAPSSTQHATQSYLGGRAGQPQSWLANETPSAPTPSPYGTAQLKGRNAQPYSWIESTHDAPSGAAYCYLGGRAGQPFSGPTQMTAKHDGGVHCARAGVTQL